MKNSILAYVILSCGSLFAAAPNADSLPPRPEILALMHRVHAYQIAHPITKPGTRSWMRDTWYTGVMEAWEATRDETFLNDALNWGKQDNWQVGPQALGANRLFCCMTWLQLYLIKHDPAMIEPTIRWLDTPATNSPAGAKRWYLDKGKPYVDALYCAEVFPMLTQITGKREYLTIMRSFFDDISGANWDEESGLYYRDPTFIGKRTAHGKKVFWSRGNGWIFAGIARMLEYLPKDDPERQKYIAIYRRMAAELIKRQSPDGFWRANLDDPEDTPNPESSGTGFFCFGLAWGINQGILDRPTFLPPTKKAYAALVSAVSPEGKVQWGQKIDEKPNEAQRESTHEYVTGIFLLASGEVYKLSR